MRPIDADALIEKFNEKASIAEALMDETKAERFRIFCLLADAVEQMPTVDVAPTVDADPAKSGEWIGTESDELVCSRCGKEAPYVSHFKETFDYDWDENLVSTGYEETKEYQRTKYCPNCGARMKEADYE